MSYVKRDKCIQCTEYYAGENGMCSACSNPEKNVFDFDSLVHFTRYMSKTRPNYTWVVLKDSQFDIVARRLTPDVSVDDWYRLLNGLTQDFPHIFLSGPQVKRIISASSSYKYVHIVYEKCYEPWDADVGHKAGNCYWRDFAEMTKPKSMKILHQIYDKMFSGWVQRIYVTLGDCPICFEKMNGSNTWSTQCCHNPVHKECINKCNTCPMCRGEYSKK